MLITMMISPDSASFIEKKRVENRLWRKSKFLWRKKYISTASPQQEPRGSRYRSRASRH